MVNRSDSLEMTDRQLQALQLLRQGAGTALTAEILATKHNVSLRQARRYVSVAALELVGEMTPHSLDVEAGTVLHRLGSIAGNAMLEQDTDLAIKATKAQAQALAQFRRAITAPATRFRFNEVPATESDSPF